MVKIIYDEMRTNNLKKKDDEKFYKLINKDYEGCVFIVEKIENRVLYIRFWDGRTIETACKIVEGCFSTDSMALEIIAQDLGEEKPIAIDFEFNKRRMLVTKEIARTGKVLQIWKEKQAKKFEEYLNSEQHKKDKKERKKKEEEHRRKAEEAIRIQETVAMRFLNQKDKKTFYAKDPAINNYAERWAVYMQTRMAQNEGKLTKEIVSEASDAADTYDNKSGHEAGAAEELLKQCWAFGAQLRQLLES